MARKSQGKRKDPGTLAALLKKEGLEQKLTMRQLNFALEYITNEGNGTQAALKAYRCSSRRSAMVLAHLTLQSPDVAAYVNAAKRLIAEEAGATFGRLVRKGVEHLEAQKVISAMVIVKPGADGRPDPGVKQVKGDSKSTDFIEVPDVDAQLKAADFLAKICGLYPQKEAQDGKAPAGIQIDVAHIYLPARDREVINASA